MPGSEIDSTYTEPASLEAARRRQSQLVTAMQQVDSALSRRDLTDDFGRRLDSDEYVARREALVRRKHELTATYLRLKDWLAINRALPAAPKLRRRARAAEPARLSFPAEQGVTTQQALNALEDLYRAAIKHAEEQDWSQQDWLALHQAGRLIGSRIHCTKRQGMNPLPRAVLLTTERPKW